MDSIILRTTTRLLFPLMLVFSVFLLIRGHNEPGGGFVGGLTAGAAFSLVLVSNGLAMARRVLRVDPVGLIAAGLAVSLASGLAPLVQGQAFLRALWLDGTVPVIGHFGSPLIFDVGVYITVLGVIMAIVFALSEEPS